MTASGSELELAGITIRYGGVTAVNDASFTVGDGILGLVGPNGAGKSTIANAISGLVRPAKGDVRWRGERITRWSAMRRSRAGLARTFQYPTIFPELTIRENILLTGPVSGLDVLRDDYDWAGLGPWLHRYPWELPYGVRKLVDFCRVLLRRPAFVIADEPLSGLAEAERDGVIDLLSQIRRSGVSLVIVEHDVPRLSQIADRLIVLDHGAMIGDGDPETVLAMPTVIEAFLGVAGEDKLVPDSSGSDISGSDTSGSDASGSDTAGPDTAADRPVPRTNGAGV